MCEREKMRVCVCVCVCVVCVQVYVCVCLCAHAHVACMFFFVPLRCVTVCVAFSLVREYIFTHHGVSVFVGACTFCECA